MMRMIANLGTMKVYLNIKELESFKRKVMILFINRSNDGFDGVFDGLNTRLQRTDILFGVFVNSRDTNNKVDHCVLHKIQIFQMLLNSIPLCLKIHNRIKIRSTNENIQQIVKLERRTTRSDLEQREKLGKTQAFVNRSFNFVKNKSNDSTKQFCYR